MDHVEIEELVRIVGEDDKERALMRAVLKEFTLNCRGRCAVKFKLLLSNYGDSDLLLIVRSARAIADRLLCRVYSEDDPRITNFIVSHLKTIRVDYLREKLSCVHKLSILSDFAVLVYNSILKNSAVSPVVTAAVAAVKAGVPGDVVAKEFNLNSQMLKYVRNRARAIEVIEVGA
jgi:hypothetical protein